MNFVQILEADTCATIGPVLAIVKWVLNLICWAVPIILIVITTLDVAKIVTAGNLDDKLKKEVTQKITTRLIYAVIIFLIPIIVNAIFSLLPSEAINAEGSKYDANWWQCWTSK